MMRPALLALAIAVLAAAPASAGFDVTGFEVTPSTPAAGAHADVTIATPRSAVPLAA
jgi:hypothetical protein